jgi:Ni/Co efflux regulator RcnB
MVSRVAFVAAFLWAPSFLALAQDPKDWKDKAEEWKKWRDKDRDRDEDKDRDKDRDKHHDEEAPKIDWGSSLPDALNKDKNILIFVHPPSDSSEIPGALAPENCRTIEKEWKPVKVAWSKDNADLAAYGIKSAPVVIAADRFGNEFKRYSGRPASEDLRGLLKAAGDAIAAYAKKLEEDMKKAEELIAARDIERALGKLQPIAASDRKGYREIKAAQDKIKSIVDSSFGEADALLKNPAGEARGVALLDSMARWFRGTEHAAAAKMRLANHYLTAGETPKAIVVLKQIEKTEPAAAKAYADLIESGMSKLRDLLATGIHQGLEATKMRVKQIQEEFEGTDVARQASEVLKDLSR